MNNPKTRFTNNTSYETVLQVISLVKLIKTLFVAMIADPNIDVEPHHVADYLDAVLEKLNQIEEEYELADSKELEKQFQFSREFAPREISNVERKQQIFMLFYQLSEQEQLDVLWQLNHPNKGQELGISPSVVQHQTACHSADEPNCKHLMEKTAL